MELPVPCIFFWACGWTQLSKCCCKEGQNITVQLSLTANVQSSNVLPRRHFDVLVRKADEISVGILKYAAWMRWGIANKQHWLWVWWQAPMFPFWLSWTNFHSDLASAVLSAVSEDCQARRSQKPSRMIKHCHQESPEWSWMSKCYQTAQSHLSLKNNI